ncbi:MAG: DUF4426 domain-containing protein [Gammaproteobacteria bacterium]|nr:DUF4426 domain-containing protein [Gammaproteobacteria bacterium]
MNIFKAKPSASWLTYSFMLLSLAFSTASLNAKDYHKVVDNYTVHYSVVNSDFLTPAVASRYGIQRSKALALVNISVLKNDSGKAVSAGVSGNAYNLAGQNKDLAFKEIKEEDAIYYISTFRFSNEERLTFKLKIRPDGTDENFEVNFEQKVYVN